MTKALYEAMGGRDCCHSYSGDDHSRACEKPQERKGIKKDVLGGEEVLGAKVLRGGFSDTQHEGVV